MIDPIVQSSVPPMLRVIECEICSAKSDDGDPIWEHRSWRWSGHIDIYGALADGSLCMYCTTTKLSDTFKHMSNDMIRNDDKLLEAFSDEQLVFIDKLLEEKKKAIARINPGNSDGTSSA